MLLVENTVLETVCLQICRTFVMKKSFLSKNVLGSDVYLNSKKYKNFKMRYILKNSAIVNKKFLCFLNSGRLYIIRKFA